MAGVEGVHHQHDSEGTGGLCNDILVDLSLACDDCTVLGSQLLGTEAR